MADFLTEPGMGLSGTPESAGSSAQLDVVLAADVAATVMVDFGSCTDRGQFVIITNEYSTHVLPRVRRVRAMVVNFIVAVWSGDQKILVIGPVEKCWSIE